MRAAVGDHVQASKLIQESVDALDGLAAWWLNDPGAALEQRTRALALAEHQVYGWARGHEVTGYLASHRDVHRQYGFSTLITLAWYAAQHEADERPARSLAHPPSQTFLATKAPQPSREANGRRGIAFSHHY